METNAGLPARRERPRGRAAEQRDERASFQLIELHSFPASQGRIAGYRIGRDQSAYVRAQLAHSKGLSVSLGTGRRAVASVAPSHGYSQPIPASGSSR